MCIGTSHVKPGYLFTSLVQNCVRTAFVAPKHTEGLPSATNIVLALVDLEVDYMAQLLLDVDFVG